MKIVKKIGGQDLEIEITKAEAKKISETYIKYRLKKNMLDIISEGQEDGDLINPVSEEKIKKVFNEALEDFKSQAEDIWDEIISESLYENFSTNL